MKKKQLINEIMGVPKAVDEWVNYLSTIVTVVVDDMVDEDNWKSTVIPYKGEEHEIYGQKKDVNGKEVTELILDIRSEDLKTFLRSETFQNFPLYNPNMVITLTILPDEIYEKENIANRMTAQHSFSGNIPDIKLGRLGKNTIFSKNKFTFNVELPISYVENKTSKHEQDLFNGLVPTVAHELTHSYQTYKQLLGGQKNVGFGRESILNALPQQMKSEFTPSWNYFLHLVYLHLSFEVNARVTELYYSMKRLGVKTQEQAMDVLVKSEPWLDYKDLKDFDSEEFIKKFKAMLHSQRDPLHDLIVLFMPKEERPPKLPDTNEEWLDTLINRWDVYIQYAQIELKELGLEVPFMERVPQKAKDNPIEFFKFFEKRFHKKAEKLRRKLTRVVSLVLQENKQK